MTDHQITERGLLISSRQQLLLGTQKERVRGTRILREQRRPSTPTSDVKEYKYRGHIVVLRIASFVALDLLLFALR